MKLYNLQIENIKSSQLKNHYYLKNVQNFKKMCF